MWCICPILGARPNQGPVVFNAASPDARRCALESPIVRVTCLVGPGQFTKFGTRISAQIVSAATRQRPRSISATVAARRRPTCRVIGTFSNNSYACWSTRTVTPARWTPCHRLRRACDRRPQIPLTTAGECTTGDSKCPSHSRQNVGSHRRQRSAVPAAPRVLAEEAVRQLTIIEWSVTPGRPAVS
jgi:hypothetical protein